MLNLYVFGGVAQMLSDAGNQATLSQMSEMSEGASLRLQAAMDRKSSFMTTLSNMMKKSSDTDAGITQNIK